jgi:hypothetical protein
MKRMRRIALIWILFSIGISIMWGLFIGKASPNGLGDFKGVYYDARCLLQHSDPYKEGEPLRLYQAEQGRLSPSSDTLRQALVLTVYLPTTFVFVAPLAMLSLGSAHLLWVTVTSGSLILAAFLMWNLGANYAPVISGALICVVLANSEVLFAFCNPAGIVVSLCLVAAWCFLKERFVPAGILCMAASLAIKPHDAGLVWLFFLLAGGVYRKRALQTALVVVVLSVPAVLWVYQVSPHWIGELHSNLSAISAHGSVNDPGLVSVTGPLSGLIIDLQSLISVFRDEPHFYNPVSYLICGVLLLVWSVRTLRLRFSQAGAWLALAAVVPLTMLVTYHRAYDAKLLLLTVPACALLWAEGGLIGWIALVVNTAGIVLTSDIPAAMLLILAKNMHISPVGLYGQIMTVVLVEPAPLILLMMCIFYLWVYLRRDCSRAAAEDGEPNGTPLAPTAV